MGAGIAAGAAVGGAALLALGKSSFDAASDLQQSTGAIDSVFGDWALDIEQSAQAAAGAVGLPTAAYENLAAVLGSQLKGAGMNIGDVTGKTQDLIGMGADLAATFGGETSDAVEALSSVLKGETDPIERYGVSIKQSDINARLAAQGQDKLTGTALKRPPPTLRWRWSPSRPRTPRGAFARESDTAAGAQQRLSAKLENLQAKLGEKLLPVFTKVATWVSDKAIPAFENLTRSGGPLQEKAAALGKIFSEKVVPALKGIWEYATTYVIPMFKNILGPALSGIRDAFKKVADKVADNRDRFSEAYEKVKPFLEFLRDKVAPIVGGVLKDAFEDAGTVLGALIDSVAWILDKGATVLGWVGNVLGAGSGESPAFGGGGTFGAPAPLRGAARGVFGAARPLTSGGGGLAGMTAAVPVSQTTITINVSGALDPQAVADQIGGLLERRARRTGALVAVAR